jgi:Transposase DDE domain
VSQIKKVRNWREYNRSLSKRGGLIFEISEEFLSSLYYQDKQKRGGIQKYSKAMFEFILTIKCLLKLPLRQTIGFTKALLVKLTGNEFIEVPNFAHVSRMAKVLDIELKSYFQDGSSITAVFDSTGVSIHSTSGWHVRKHGSKNRSPNESWLKVHIMMDAHSGNICSLEVTQSNSNDCTQVRSLLSLYEKGLGVKNLKRVDRMLGDGAYDTYEMYELGEERGAQVVVPPSVQARSQAELKHRGRYLDYLRQRDESISYIRGFESYESGLRSWKKQSGYHQRSKVEACMFRLKRICGFNVQMRKIESIRNEMKIKANILNRMLQCGRAEYIR